MLNTIRIWTIALTAFLLLSPPAKGQILSSGPAPSFDHHAYGIGVGTNTSAPHNTHGLAFYAEKLTGVGTYSYTRFDIFGGNTMTTTGVAQAILSVMGGRVVCFGHGTAGMSTANAGSVGNAFAGGGDCFFRLNKLVGTENNYVSFGGDVIKNNVGIPSGGYSLRVTFTRGMSQ